MRMVIVAGLVLALAAVAAASPAVETVDGIPHIMNDAPAEGAQRVDLVERWRAGGEDDVVFFGVIRDAAPGPDGQVYLLDGQLSEVQVYDADGKHLGTLGREGDGPGEFRRPAAVVPLPGGRVGVTVGQPGRIITLEADGTPGPSIRPAIGGEGGFGMLVDVLTRGDRMVACGMQFSPGEEGMTELRYLSICDMDGNELHRLWEITGTRDFSKPKFVEKDEYFAMGRFAVDSAGRVYVAMDYDRYAVSVFAPDGTLERVIERPDYQGRMRSKEEKEEVTSGMRIVANGRTLELENVVEDRDQAIESLFVDGEDRLWVRDSHSEEHAGVFRRYDVFDADGAWLRSVDLVLPGDQEEDGLFPLGDGRFAQIRGLQGAQAAMFADVEGGSDDEEDLGDAEPLEVVLWSLP